VPELHSNAASWCEDHGLIDDAVGHAGAAGDHGWAARLVERHAEEVYQRGEGATVNRWLQAIPLELIRARPQLSLAKAASAVVEGRFRLEDIAPSPRTNPARSPAPSGSSSARPQHEEDMARRL
jgi:ATP/maltotriose-dependent transcriptional regulator MalT